jgi:hypothetical protein
MRTALQKVLALMEQKQERRRSHFQRGRRGPDRGGADRRPQQTQAQEKPGRDQVDVEQIMRDIRGRIAERQGIDLSTQQIQDLAARRLESILDPRTIKPSLLDAMRRAAGTGAARGADKAPNEPAYTFEDSTIYESHRGALSLIRRLLNPLLKLFFNPNPLIRALHVQAQLNVEAAERDAERSRWQTEWNALHYEIVQRLVTEVSQVSLELKSLVMRVESLDAKVDFNERRVRGIEGSVHRSRPQGRPAEPIVASTAVGGGETAPADAVTETSAASVEGPPSDGTKRRRRRRRGRRTDMSPSDTVSAGQAALVGEPLAATALTPPPGGSAETLPTVEPVSQESEAGSVAVGIPAEPFVQSNPAAPAPAEIPAPQPAVEHFAQNSPPVSAPAGRPTEPQPTVEHLAQDSEAVSAPTGIPSAPQPAAENLAQDSGAVPGPTPVAERPDADRTEF